MAVTKIAMNAYQNALETGKRLSRERQGTSFISERKEDEGGFAKAIEKSLGQVNQMQSEKSTMIESFASGETQNVHELMITLQKAGLAMSMTTAVRGKIMEAYKELTRMSM